MSIEKLSAIWPEWKIVEQIGEGSFGKVYKAVREEHTMTTYAAIKVISIPQSDTEVSSLRSEGLDDKASKTYFEGIVKDFVNEIKLMESVKGTSNIVSVEDFRVFEKEDKIGWDIFIRMELLTPFNEYVTNHPMTEKEVIKLGTDICSALELCTQKNIIHRDIKPENIFISSFGDFKVGDFGIAKELEKTSGVMSSKGTFNYMAPEIAAGKKYDSTVDIYSLGLVLYKLLNNNRLPFIDPYAQQIQYQDRKNATDRRLGGEPIPVPVNASPQLAEIILAACCYDPTQRFSTPTAFKNALLAVSDLGVVAPKAAPKIDLNATTAARPAPASQTNIGYNVPPQVQTFDKPQKAPKKKMSKGKKAKIILITISVAILALAITLVSVFFTSPAYGVSKNMKSENYSEALSDYNTEVKDNFIQELILGGILKGYDNEIIQMFKNREIDYNSAVDALETLDKMGFDGSAEKVSEIKNIKEANSALEKGNEYYESGDYENAIKEYSKIIESNENYDAAQTKLTELYPKYISSIVERAKSYNSAKNYEEAVAYVNTAYDILPDGVDKTELDKIKSESLTSYKSQIMDQVTTLINASKFEDALDLIDEAIVVDDNEDFRNTKTTTETKYVEYISITVEDYLDNRDYNSALKVVKKALTVLPGNPNLTSLQTKVVNETPTYLNEIVVVDSQYYSYNEDIFTDSFGNVYDGYHWFDSCYYNAYVVYNLNEKYTEFNCSIVAAQSTGSNLKLSVAIYLDGKLAYTLTDFTKTTGKQDIAIDVTNITKLEIKTAADRYDWYDYSHLAMVNASVK